METMMSTPQEYWDACLIKAWRNDGQLIEAFTMFQSITGKKTLDIDSEHYPMELT